MVTSTRNWLVTAASLALAATLLTPQTQAQFYIGAEAGWTGLPYKTDTIPGVTSVTVQFNPGFNGGVRGGYEWGAWRFEEEYSYRQNGVANKFYGAGSVINGASGNRHTNSIMTNVS